MVILAEPGSFAFHSTPKKGAGIVGGTDTTVAVDSTDVIEGATDVIHHGPLTA